MISVAGVELEVLERGQGTPILYLHGGSGVALDVPFIERMAKVRRVIAPSHPGFGKSALPEWLDGIDDIAHIYLELMDRLGLDAGRPRRLLGRRLDRRGDRHEGAGTAGPTWRSSARSASRPAARRQTRHPGRLRDAAGQARPIAVPRSAKKPGPTSDAMSEEELQHRRPQQRDAGAADLGAVHAQSQAQAPAASRDRSHAVRARRQMTASSRRNISNATRRSFQRPRSRPSRRPGICRMSSSLRRLPRRSWVSCDTDDKMTARSGANLL